MSEQRQIWATPQNTLQNFCSNFSLIYKMFDFRHKRCNRASNSKLATGPRASFEKRIRCDADKSCKILRIQAFDAVAGAACFFSIKNVALAKKCKKVKSNWKVCCAFFCSWDCIGQECSRNRNIAEIYLWPKNKSIFLAKKCEGWPLSVLSVAIYRGTEAVIRDSTDICDVGKLFIFSLFPYFKQNCKVFIGQENEN